MGGLLHGLVEAHQLNLLHQGIAGFDNRGWERTVADQYHIAFALNRQNLALADSIFGCLFGDRFDEGFTGPWCVFGYEAGIQYFIRLFKIKTLLIHIRNIQCVAQQTPFALQ